MSNSQPRVCADCWHWILAAAAAGAMVIVNTVVLVRGGLGLGETDVALALGFFGGGSMLAALMLPRLLDHVPDRLDDARGRPRDDPVAGCARRVDCGGGTGLDGVALSVAPQRPRVLGGAHALRPSASSIGAFRGPSRGLRRPVCPQPYLLARHLSAIGLVDHRVRPCDRAPGALGHRRNRYRTCAASVARGTVREPSHIVTTSCR